ncbi:MAG: hypothetical protein KJ072_18160 [Verrucomicrobia bacterium]|nr:hypothetical protein [Verrucomicrobiota bacterium]
MKAILYILLLAIGTSQALGQAHIIKQRARELSDQNNARQGITPNAPTAPTRATPPSPQPAAPPQPMFASPEQLRQHDISTLKAEVARVEPGVAIDQTWTGQLTKNLTTAARGTVKPSAKTTSQLAGNLGAALGQARLTAANQAQMAEDMVAILNCGGVAADQTQSRITSVQATLQRGGVERKLAVAVANDLKAVAAEIQQPGAKR